MFGSLSASVCHRKDFEVSLAQVSLTMKTVFVFLVIAVAYICGTPVDQLKELKEQVDELMKKLSTEQLDTFVIELEKNVTHDCKPDFFCKVEKVLGNKTLSQFSEFHKGQGLLRQLRAHNQHVKSCSVKDTGIQTTLHLFLQHLNKCIQKNISCAQRN